MISSIGVDPAGARGATLVALRTTSSPPGDSGNDRVTCVVHCADRDTMRSTRQHISRVGVGTPKRVAKVNV